MISCIRIVPGCFPETIMAEPSPEGMRDALGFAKSTRIGAKLVVIRGAPYRLYYDYYCHRKNLFTSVLTAYGGQFVTGPVLVVRVNDDGYDDSMSKFDVSDVMSEIREFFTGHWVLWLEARA